MIPDSEDRRPGLAPPKFGLSSLMIAIGILGLLFALMHYVGMLGFTIALFFALCVIAHVAGNAIGTRLRDMGTSRGTAESPNPRRNAAVSASDFAPVSRLRHRSSLGKRNIVITAIGAVVGGALGGFALQWLSGPDAPWSVVVLGFSASAVLAGIWTFAAASFTQVMLGAWFHASRESRKK